MQLYASGNLSLENYYGSRDLIRERMPIERNMNVMIETYGQILEAIQRNCKLKNFRSHIIF